MFTSPAEQCAGVILEKVQMLLKQKLSTSCFVTKLDFGEWENKTRNKRAREVTLISTWKKLVRLCEVGNLGKWNVHFAML